MKRAIFILILSIIFSGLDCKKSNEKEKTRGTAIPRKEAEIVIPKDVRSQWKSVRIQLTDKEKGTKKIYEIGIGSEMNLDDTGLNLEVLHFAPDFKMGQGEITSASAEPKNPAVQIVVKEVDKTPVKLWLFLNYPDVHSFVHPKYQLALVGFEKAK